MSTWSKSIMMSDCYLYPFEIEMGGIFLLTKSYLWERVVAITEAFGRKVICVRERERELLLLLQHLDEKLSVRESCCYYCCIWTKSYLWERVAAITAAFGRKVICERFVATTAAFGRKAICERELLLLLQHLDGKLFVRELLLLLQHLASFSKTG